MTRVTTFRLVCSAVGVLLTAHAGGAAAEQRRPNVVVLVADDLGYGDVGCYGGEIPTPRIDALARGGIRCTAGYVTCPACAPSRFSLMAGCYPQRFGLTWNDDRGRQAPLPAAQRLLPEVMRDAGYVTGLVGKWNIVRPAAEVFDEVHDELEWESDYFPQPDGRYVGSGTDPKAYGSSKESRWGTAAETTAYLPDVMGRHAADFVTRHADKPFCLVVGFNAPHSPWQGRAADRDRFAGLPHEVSRLYASMVAGLDDGVGRVLDALRRAGVEDDTLVVFVSDNGPAKGSMAIKGWQEGWPERLVVGSAGPFRGAKTDLLEGGIREPFIVRWPRRLPAGGTYDAPVSTMDLLPTVTAAAGLPVPPGTQVDGIDLLPFLTAADRGRPHDILFWKIKSATAVRRGRWKLVMQSPDWQPLLFDLDIDPAEARDRAADQPALVAELQAAWRAWDATLPPPARR